ncbi:MAG: tyrosine-type recombinase/integrase, partial [Nitrosomonadales bacterium]|nr:tyrosine-type recombinase/integrase [Nitrosomonadales bacterium]
WRNVDLDAKIFRVIDTKNGEDHTLPLSDFLYDMLLERRMNIFNRYVFPGDTKEGYILLPQKLMDRVARESGVSFTLHDLRRTFITIAEGLDIPAYALKRLLNHKMRNDVTAGYIITDVERLRIPMQKVADYIKQIVGVKFSASVLPFQVKSA